MKEIQLGGHRKTSKIRGFTLVDDEDFTWLNQWKWHLSKSYAAANIGNYKRIFMHVLLLNPPKGYLCDHINRNGLDNRRKNLRICTVAQNTYNTQKRKNSKTSIYKGVYQVTKMARLKTVRWSCQINVKNKRVHIGYFDTEHHAAIAYDLWADDLFGEFAKLNFSKLE